MDYGGMNLSIKYKRQTLHLGGLSRDDPDLSGRPYRAKVYLNCVK